MKYHVAFGASLVTLLFAPAAHANMGSYVNLISKVQTKMQEKAPNFRLIMSEEKFDERFNATIAIPVDTKPSGAVATLHDFRTGEPLESCTTPCELHVDSVRTYGLVLFKFGHAPYMRAIGHKEARDERPPTWLGIDYLEATQNAKKCYKDFASAPKVDGDAMPCMRVPPIMPPNAKHSGHCKLKFDVTDRGRTENITAISCTEDLFKRASIQSVKLWVYTPKVERGQAVSRPGVETKVSFKLSDVEGNLIPEP